MGKSYDPGIYHEIWCIGMSFVSVISSMAMRILVNKSH